MSNIIRILHVLGKMDIGGIETMLMNLYRNIDRSKIQFDFILHTSEECFYNAEIREMGGIIFAIQKFRGYNYLQYKKEWKEFFIKHPEYTIIHGHMNSTAAIYLGIAHKLRYVTIAHSHSISNGKGLGAFVKNIMQYKIRYIADYFFACSIAAGKWLFGNDIVNSSRFYIFENGICIEQYLYNPQMREQIRMEHCLADNFVIGHVGRFVDVKNHEFLIQVFKKIYQEMPNAFFMLIGEGKTQSNIREKVKMNGIEQAVLFLGNKDNVNDYLQAMDIFVFPSKYEGLGMAVIEAQYAGLRVICSDRVPKESDVTGHVDFLPLEYGSEYWGKFVMGKLNIYDRRLENSKIEKSSYHIKAVAEKLEQLYVEIVKENNS